MKNIAIFASGTGTNARKIIDYFKDRKDIAVRLVVSNRASAPVLDIAEENGIDTLVLDRSEFYETHRLLEQLRQYAIDFIVLAGFLWLAPPYLVDAFRGRMINIHPALLPKFGGKGMFGRRVHEAVAAAGETETGITIHYVNEVYDSGAVIFQARCPVGPGDSPDEIANRVRQLEHRYFPVVIEKLIMGETIPRV